MQNKDKIFSAFKYTLSIIFLLSVWQFAAIIIDHPFLLPSIPDTLKSLLDLVVTKEFYLSTFYTLCRVFFGLLLGSLLGIVLAVSAYKVTIIKILLAPLVSIMKATPIASIIIVLYILMSGNALSIVIAVLMVFPIVWQNITDAFKAIPRELREVCDVFEFSFSKRLKVLYLPTLLKYFLPAFITAIGFAWKATVSAEIIAYTQNSIGQYINDAKYEFDSPKVFAWTLTVTLLSIAFEKIATCLLRRYKKWD